MYVRKNFNLKAILGFSGVHIIWLSIWATISISIYQFSGLKWLAIPWLPLSVIGTAVAFYVGFKNNSAYDRLWEARKIWGGIVNDSRSWGACVISFVNNLSRDKDVSEYDLNNIKKDLIYRHIAWLYTLRSQLLVPTEWEHINQGNHIGKTTKKRMKKYGVGMYVDELTMRELKFCLHKEELKELEIYNNVATHIIDNQSRKLAGLREDRLIDDFRHMELQKILNSFYTLQGKCERIKKFPFPRQYGSMSFVFIGIFIFLLPLGMVSEFEKLGTHGVWLSLPFTVLVGWIYVMMELVGDYSENPFEGLGNDIPMYSLCRTIEIDLRQMLGETDIPKPVQPKNGILM